MFIQRIFFILILSLTSLLAYGEVYFPKTLHSKQRPLSLHLQTEYYNTVSNYTVLGQYANLKDQNFFNVVSSNLSIDYSPAKFINIETFLGSRWAASQTDRELKNRLALSYVGGGLTLSHKMKNFSIALEFQGGYPLHEASDNNQIIIGDGTYFLKPSLWLAYQHSTKIFSGFYNIQLLYRNSLSSLLKNKIGLLFQTDFVNFGFSTEASLPVIKDVFTQDPSQRWNLLNKTNGGSYKFYSINPGLLSFTSWIEWEMKYTLIKFYTHLDTYGQNYAKGITLGMVTSFKWNTKAKKKSSYHFLKSQKNPSPNRTYYNDDDDNRNPELMKELKKLR